MTTVVKVSDICAFKKGRKPDNYLVEPTPDSKPYILIESFGGTYKTFTNDGKGTTCTLDDTLIVCDGANSGLTSFGHSGYIGSTIAALSPDKSKIQPKFLYYFVHRQFNLLNTRTRGAAIPHLERNLLLSLSLVLPSLAEQERIVRLLDETESLRQLRHQADMRMATFIPALFHDMFGGQEYPVMFLRDVAEVVSGVAKGRRLGNAAVIVPYIRVANVQAGYLDLAEIKTIEALPKEVNELRLMKGDVLLTEGGDFDKLGRGALLEVDLPENCIHQNHVFRVRVHIDKLEPIYFAEYLQTDNAKGYFLQCAKKTTNLASINMTQLRGLPVPMPPLALQREFTKRVQEARALLVVQAKSAERNEALYQSMLSKAFAGEL